MEEIVVETKMEVLVPENKTEMIVPETKVNIKEEPMSILIEFENNMGQSSFTLPEHIQRMQPSNQNGNDENSSTSASSTDKKRAQLPQKGLKIHGVNC
jgi:hypothetical protein